MDRLLDLPAKTRLRGESEHRLSFPVNHAMLSPSRRAGGMSVVATDDLSTVRGILLGLFLSAMFWTAILDVLLKR